MPVLVVGIEDVRAHSVQLFVSFHIHSSSPVTVFAVPTNASNHALHTTAASLGGCGSGSRFSGQGCVRVFHGLRRGGV